MKKKELISAISERAGITKTEAETALTAVFGSITDLLAKGDSIIIPNFATLSVKKRAARAGRNPSTGATINIPATNVVNFRVGSKLKETINAEE